MKPLRDYSKQFVTLVAAVALLLFLQVVGALSPVESFLSKILSPLLSRVFAISNFVGQQYSLLEEKQSLIAENTALKNRLAAEMRERGFYLAEKEENEFLRAQLHFVPPQDYDYKIARVIGKNVDPAQNTLLVEAGAIAGVKKGQSVLTAEGILVGKIVKVNQYDAFVLLINDDTSRIAAKVANEDKTQGLVEGQYGLGIIMRYLPQSDDIKPGDLVVTSGLEEQVPAGLPLGEIATLIGQPEDLFRNAIITSPVDFNKITYVNILIKKAHAE